ncbi:transcriptional regulator NrdR [Candidatus Nanohalovita haloferacivicina]|uniref:transcriptional regulator NrdR n=1 Tax=Candidatus Nanohalovita haloferacivicina TaxID=2978046 RepID=UPI00325FD334
MKCIYCDESSTRVVDTRESEDKVRRRRECKDCGRRFTTYETAEKLDLTVVKRDKEDEKFQEEKVREGVEIAANKTSITDEEVEEIVENVKSMLRGRKKIEAEKIGKKVKEELQKRDEVAYIRFTSVYDSFDDVESFKKEIEALKED